MKKSLALWILIIVFALSACNNGSGSATTDTDKREQADSQTETKELTKQESQAEEANANNQTRMITDAAGRQVEIPQELKSIICVNVGALRFTSYMLATDLVVGVEENEMNPSPAKPFSYIHREKFANLPHIGNNGKTFDEEIIKLKPQVIMMAGDKEAADMLQAKVNIPVVALPLIDDMFSPQVDRMLELMGLVYNRQERADQLIAYIQAVKADLAKRTADIKEEDRPKVYVAGVSFKGHHGFEGTEANYSPLAAIGANNLANQAGQKGAYNIDLEKVLVWNPDIVLVDFNGLPLIQEDYRQNPEYYQSLAAVANGQVYSQISFRYNAVNAELSMADAYYAGKVIYPDRFADVDVAVKADEIFETMLGVKFYDTLKANGYEFRPIKIGE